MNRKREWTHTGIGHRDVGGFVGIEPYFALPALHHRCGEPLLDLQRHHFLLLLLLWRRTSPYPKLVVERVHLSLGFPIYWALLTQTGFLNIMSLFKLFLLSFNSVSFVCLSVVQTQKKKTYLNKQFQIMNLFFLFRLWTLVITYIYNHLVFFQ